MTSLVSQEMQFDIAIGGGRVHSFLHLSPLVFKVAILKIARRILNAFPYIGGFDEACGWASLGVSHALKKFKRMKMTKTRNRGARVYSYLFHKGYYCAVDQMRYERAIPRARNGKVYNARIITHTFTDLRAPDSEVAIEPADHRERPPDQIAMARDMIEFATKNLSGSAWDVFNLHFIEDVPFRQVAKTMGVTFSRVYQIGKAIIQSLYRHITGGESLPAPKLFRIRPIKDTTTAQEMELGLLRSILAARLSQGGLLHA